MSRIAPTKNYSSSYDHPQPLPGALIRHRLRLEAKLFSTLSRNDSELYRILRYHLGWEGPQTNDSPASTGKSFRPALCILSCQASGGTSEIALPAAVAVELIHNFSLIHDDIQDRDTERRHRATVWTLWGEPAALNAGNALRSVADLTLQQLEGHGISALILLKASELLTQSSLKMIQGQYLDISFEQRLDVSTSEYKKMIAYKTGALISCAMQLGTMVGSKDPSFAQAMGDLGRDLGYLFQIRDDLLGIWGEESATGKPKGSDIRRKKKSYPIVYGLQHATGTAKTTLERNFRKHTLSDRDIRQTIDLLDELHAREETQALAVKMSLRAKQGLKRVSLPSEWAADFRELIDFLLLRGA